MPRCQLTTLTSSQTDNKRHILTILDTISLGQKSCSNIRTKIYNSEVAWVQKLIFSLGMLHINIPLIYVNRKVSFSGHSCVWMKIYADVLYLDGFGDT